MSPIYDFTRDGDGSIHNEFFRKSVVIKSVIKAATIIASDTTLTTNGVIAAADVIQVIDIPAGFVFKDSAILSVTAEVGAHTADVGIAGSNEIFSNYDLTTAAGTYTLMDKAVGWGVDTVQGYVFSAADTIDMTFDHETDAGEWHLFIAGWFLG